MNTNAPNVNKLGALADGKSSYERWTEEQGVPILKAFFIPDLNEVTLGRWERKGGRGPLLIWKEPATQMMLIFVSFLPAENRRPNATCTKSLSMFSTGGAPPRFGKRGTPADFRVASRKPVRDPAQCLVPTLQRQRASNGPLYWLYFGAAHDESFERPGIYLQLPLYFS